MEKESNILSRFKDQKQNAAFKVPDGYFDTVLPRVQALISESQEKSKSKIRLFSLRPLYTYGIIAVVTVFILFIGIKVLVPFGGNPHKLVASQEEIASFLDREILTIDDATIALEIENDKKVKNVQSENEINYLIENNIESSEILTEL